MRQSVLHLELIAKKLVHSYVCEKFGTARTCFFLFAAANTISRIGLVVSTSDTVSGLAGSSPGEDHYSLMRNILEQDVYWHVFTPTQRFIPPGSINRIPGFSRGLEWGMSAFVKWQVKLCNLA